MSSLDTQVGGNHYKGMAIQPAQYIVANGIGFLEGMVIKYVSRWEKKGGIEDLEKAIHCLQLLIEMRVKQIPDGETTEGGAHPFVDELQPEPIPVGESTDWGGLGE